MATATLLGSGILALLAGLYAWRFQYRTLLLLAAVLMAATSFGFPSVADFWPLLAIAVVGTLNPSGGDVSVFLPLEHALPSINVTDAKRTAVFTRYSLVCANCRILTKSLLHPKSYTVFLGYSKEANP